MLYKVGGKYLDIRKVVGIRELSGEVCDSGGADVYLEGSPVIMGFNEEEWGKLRELMERWHMVDYGMDGG